MTKTNSVEGYYSCKLAKKFKEEFQDFCNKEKIDYDFIENIDDAGMLYSLFDVYIKTPEQYNKLKIEGMKLFSFYIVEA